MNNQIISKELLSAVLNKNVTEVEYCETCRSEILDLVVPGSIAFTTDTNKRGMWMNIHDISHECKLWALKYEY